MTGVEIVLVAHSLWMLLLSLLIIGLLRKVNR